MQVLHSIPAGETRLHTTDEPCACVPHQHVTAAPDDQPVVHLTHRSLATRKATR